MNSKRSYFLLLGVTVLLCAGLLAGAYGTNMLLTQRANKLTSLKAKSRALDKQQVILNKAKQDIAKYANLKRITQTVVPQEKNQAAAVREIINAATANGTTITGISFPASTLGKTAAPTGGTAAAPATAAPVSAAQLAQADFSQLTKVPGIPGVYQLVINIQNDTSHEVTYPQFINFLKALEQNRHTAQVTNLTLSPDAKNRANIQFSLTIVEYVKP